MFSTISGRRNRVVPISLWSQCLHRYAFAAELVRPDLRLHIGKVPARRKRDKEHPGAAGEGQTVAAVVCLYLTASMTARSTSHQNWTMRDLSAAKRLPAEEARPLKAPSRWHP